MAFDFENGSYTDAAGRTVLDPAVYKDWQIGAAAEQALGDYRRFAELDVRFHSLLSRATGNQVAMIVTDVLGQVEQHTLLKKMETLNDSACLALERRILARHREILSAIRRQDDAAAKQAMREHTRAAATDLKV